LEVMLLWIAVNMQQYKCKYGKPQFNSSVLARGELIMLKNLPTMLCCTA